jgi:hypothetical protein
MNPVLRGCLAISLAWVASSPLLAQETAAPSCFVPFVLRDAQGELIHNIAASDLIVKVGGNSVAISQVSRERRPRRIVMVLDASGSMSGVDNSLTWRRALASAKLLTSLAEGRAKVALIIFNAKVVDEIGLNQGNDAVAQRLEGLEKGDQSKPIKVYGQTALYDAIGRAIEILDKPTSADVIYVIGDAGENVSHLSRSKLTSLIDQSGVRIFANLLQPDVGPRYRSRTSSKDAENLLELTQSTGGDIIQIAGTQVHWSFQSPPKLPIEKGLQLFLAAIFENDVIEFPSSNLRPGKRDVAVSIADERKSSLPNSQLSYPHQLSSCVQ